MLNLEKSELQEIRAFLYTSQIYRTLMILYQCKINLIMNLDMKGVFLMSYGVSTFNLSNNFFFL